MRTCTSKLATCSPFACGVVGLAAATADDAAPVRVPAQDVIALRAHDIPGLEAEQLFCGRIPGDDALVAVDDVGAVGGAVEQFAQELLLAMDGFSYRLWPGGRRWDTGRLYGLTPRAMCRSGCGRNMHQGVEIVGVDGHAGQAGIVMVQHAGFLLGIVDGDAGQPLGDMARTAAGRVARHGDRFDNATLGIDGDVEDGPPKWRRTRSPAARHRWLAPAAVDGRFGERAEWLGEDGRTPCAASQPANWFISPGGNKQATLSMGTSAIAPHMRTMSAGSSPRRDARPGPAEVGRERGGQVLFGIVDDGRQQWAADGC